LDFADLSKLSALLYLFHFFVNIIRHVYRLTHPVFQCTSYNIIQPLFVSYDKLYYIVIIPVIGLVQSSHFLANNCAKHGTQYGLSSCGVNLSSARILAHWVQRKHSRCHDDSLYVTPLFDIGCKPTDNN